MLLSQIYFSNRDIFARLKKLTQPAAVETDAAQEERAWNQISSLGWNHVVYEFVETFILVLLPLLAYAYFVQKTGTGSLVYISLSLIAASLTNVALELLLFDYWLEPVRNVLLPAAFGAQLAGLKVPTFKEIPGHYHFPGFDKHRVDVPSRIARVNLFFLPNLVLPNFLQMPFNRF